MPDYDDDYQNRYYQDAPDLDNILGSLDLEDDPFRDPDEDETLEYADDLDWES